MKYNDKIYFIDDVINIYTERRKNIKREEVEDLMRCLISFLKNDVKEDKEYAYDIPSIGMMYLPFEKVEPHINYRSKRTDRFDKMMFETMLSNKSPLLLTPKYEGADLKELQRKQNEY